MNRVVHCKKEKYDVLIDRTTKWGNPFTHLPLENTLAKFQVKTREEAIAAHKKWITEGEGQYLLNDLHELKDKVLGCWCKPDKSCHGDTLAELTEKKFGI